MEWTSATYAPILVCSCGTAFHADQLGNHADYWHSPQFPAFPHQVSREDHAAAGWDVSDWPRSVRMHHDRPGIGAYVADVHSTASPPFRFRGRFRDNPREVT